MEKKAEVMFEGVTYSSLYIINKERLMGEWQVFQRAVFQVKKVMTKNKHQPSIFAGHKRHHGNKLCLYFQNLLKLRTLSWCFNRHNPSGKVI